jgi:TolB protein
MGVVMFAPGETKAAFPGSNGLIAWESNVDHTAFGPDYGRFEIYTMNPDGSNKTRLTTASGSDPAFSPDGKKIVFVKTGDPVSYQPDIYVMNADGSDQTQLTTNTEPYPYTTENLDPAWSPDGKKIAFTRFVCCPPGWHPDIWVMNADGSDPTNLTSEIGGIGAAESVGFPAWSPDGKKIAYARDSDIWLMNADGSDQTNLTNFNNFDFSNSDPNWSPDGSRILFDSNRATPRFGVDLYTMKPDGSDVQRITTDRVSSMGAFSPDGKQIVFRSFRDFNDEIYVMNADGSGASRLTNNAAPGNTLPEDFFPDWQPVKSDTTPPVVTVPSDITTNATSPSGAPVTFSASATDDTDPDPTLRCLPSSGSAFAIGTTQVTCTATDASNNSASASFNVKVKGAAEQLTDLIGAATGLGPGNSLKDKANLALIYLNAQDPADACSTLKALINQVQAQAGKTLGATQAFQLTAAANRIRTVLNC